MRLRGLELADFRKFEGSFRLEGLGDGVNVLCEANEFGKSTLLAAIKAALFERHNSKADTVARLRHSRNATSPMVRLDFELDGGLHRLEKRFLHREPYARLHLPDGRRLDGDAAEESLQQLLGFMPAGRRGASAETQGLWSVLWVEQRGSLDQPALGDSGRASLHGCLEEELGGITGDDIGAKVQQDVKAALFVLLDGRDRPKGRYKELGDAIAATERTLETLANKHANLTEDIEALGKTRRALGRAEDPEADARLQADLTAARKLRDAVRDHTSLLAQRVSERQTADLAVADAAGETERRAERQLRIEAADQRVLVEAAAVQTAQEELAGARDAVRSARAAADAAEALAADAAGASRQAASVLAVVGRAARLRRLEARLGRAATAESRAHELKGALAANLADETRLAAIRAADTTLARARAALDAQAVDVELDLEDGAVGQVQIAGTTAAIGMTRLRLVDDAVLEIAGVGRIAIRPAIRDHAKLRASIGKAEVGLTAALAAAGVANVADATVQAAARTALERQLREAEATLAAETPAEPEDGLAHGVGPLREHIEVLRAGMAASLAAIGLAALPTAEVAETEALAAAAREQAAREAVDAARQALSGPETALARISGIQIGAETALRAAQEDVARLRQEAAGAAAVEPADALRARLTTLRAAAQAAADAVAQIERNRPAETQDGVDARIQRLEQAARSRSEMLRALKEDIAKLGTRVALLEGEGIDEQIALTRAELEVLRTEFDGLQREADALRLLRDTLADAERAMRERFVAPLVRRLTPYLQGLFPGVTVSCDETLQVSELARHRGEESFAHLSDGTREQVAVLLRLAYADLLLERGRPAMLILDDALAYSDPDRLEQMFDLITTAARRMQVLMLTCRTSAFSRMGGNRVRLVAAETMAAV